MADKLQWGIIGTGSIAGKFAQGVLASRTGSLLAVGSRQKETADAFADEFRVERRYGSYEELLADPDVQAVYIAVPHTFHAEWAVKAADAGKHLLVEKPIGINHAEAMAIVEAAVRNDVFLMEAFMYRCHPQTAKLVELVKEGAIGEVRSIKASFAFRAGFNPESRLFNPELAGGGILDVGCYPVSLSRLIAGAALGRPFAEPVAVSGYAHLGETGVDEWAVASVRFPGDILAQISTGILVREDNAVRIFGTEGSITVPWPWIPGRDGEPTSIFLQRDGREEEEIVIKPDRPLYAIEADTVAENIENRQAPSPAMSWDDSLGNMKMLDAWREAVGLVYPMEKPERQTRPISGEPLRVREPNRMKYGNLPGLDKPVSRLVMGVDNQRTCPHACVMFDDFFERGGNTFDTAYIYRGGTAEKLLGHWVESRGVREQVVILDKGAHTPECYPEALSRQLLESLERLRTDYVDIYMMHRDNLDVPVGEFIDVLNEHVQAGRIKVFGVSNWTKERVDAANEYARANGLAGIVAVSNNFSLARMMDPVWPGCIASSSPDYVQWHKERNMPLFPWSSQARGFFVEGRAHPDKKDDPELVRCWYGPENFKRLERARELARKKGVLPINIALAYVLNQPFPTFPLIGPRSLSETRTSFPGLEVDLSPEELAWLNLEE